MIARVLDDAGYRIGIIERPGWTDDADFARLGRPRLYFGLTSGSIDSMLVNYTPLKRRREKDEHAPHASGMPDRALIVYANRVRSAFPGVPVVLGGIEASLRRFAHYDYWDDDVRRGLLLDTRADILVYGPGESQAVEIARRMDRGEDLAGIAGTCVIRREKPDGFEEMPPYRRSQARTTTLSVGRKTPSPSARPWPSATPSDMSCSIPRPSRRRPTSTASIACLSRGTCPPHFPEFRMAQFSVVTHRGCIGDCSFCSLTLHQGDRIVSRSEGSILDEIRRLTAHPDFKGFIDDLGGPSANMYGMDCPAPCEAGGCLACGSLDRGHGRLIGLMRKARAIPGVKKVFVRSGVRYDLALESEEYIRELSEHHVSGLLKIAPEHVAPGVLALMNKDGSRFEEFRRLFRKLNKAERRHLKYYYMVAHPGCGEDEARELAVEVKRLEREGEKPVEGVQIFTPTPMTRSTCMYRTGRDPITGAEVFVPRTFAEKKAQKRLLG